MNAVEIEEEVSKLTAAPFVAAEFPFRFLEAFDFNATAVNKLRAGGKGHNKSDVPGAFLTGHRNNVHLAVCPPGATCDTLKKLLASPATAKHKAKFALATDGTTIEAANLTDDTEPPLVCEFAKLGDHFGYFLGLAGISAVKAIRENAFDIKATGRLNRLYVELIRHNPGWDGAARREGLNHFFARLIFCFFAEDTGIFHGDGLFTATVTQMSAADGTNTAFVLDEIFRAMDLPPEARDAAKLRPWANEFPYVNGGLFGGAGAPDDVPRFSKIARSYLLHVGSLDWTKINPDIFGSMIQAVADDAERASLGMHYTSVPNILKVLNPLFLDDLRAKLAEAGGGGDQGSLRKLFKLRRRLARIRVFDPACGSGNFLVIAYKEMRAIEAKVNRLRGEPNRDSDIPLTNFRGIELRHFAVEIARLALVIAEFQCNALYLGDPRARLVFLPLHKQNWITHGNALRLDWLSVCPPGDTEIKPVPDGLFPETPDEPEVEFENEGGETYICGNPPYKGQSEQTDEQKDDLRSLFDGTSVSWKNLDYVSGWFYKYCKFQRTCSAFAAFVSTNSVVQGQQVAGLWPHIFNGGVAISFARTSFKWKNLAAHNAGVIVVVIGMKSEDGKSAMLISEDETDSPSKKIVSFLGPYLVPDTKVIVDATRVQVNGLPSMDYGSKPADGGGLIVSPNEFLNISDQRTKQYIKPYVGSDDFIDGKHRYCLWVEKDDLNEARQSEFIAVRESRVRAFRSASKKGQTRELAELALRFAEVRHDANGDLSPIIIPIHTSEDRQYLPVGMLSRGAVVSNAAFGLYRAPLWCMGIIASKLHLVWIATVCGKLKTDYRYSNTLGWNTFPVPPLSASDKDELTRRAEDILLTREAYWPATIAEMYDPDAMDAKYPDLRAAHDRNDETLERIYIGRRFRNDTERLEKLFQMYTQMTKAVGGKKPKGG